jgi:hypothetical protein
VWGLDGSRRGSRNSHLRWRDRFIASNQWPCVWGRTLFPYVELSECHEMCCAVLCCAGVCGVKRTAVQPAPVAGRMGLGLQAMKVSTGPATAPLAFIWLYVLSLWCGCVVLTRVFVVCVVCVWCLLVVSLLCVVEEAPYGNSCGCNCILSAVARCAPGMQVVAVHA